MSSDPAVWSWLLPGITLGFAAAAQPGPLSIYLISRTLQAGWKRTLPAVFAPLVSDGPIAVVCLLILGNLPQNLMIYIQVAGGFFILYLGYQAARAWKKSSSSGNVSEISTARTLRDAIVINFLNPGPYLGWSLVIGPLFLKGWKENAWSGISLLTGFYVTMFLITILIILLFHYAGKLGSRLQRILLILSAVFLALFGIYQLVDAGMHILNLSWK